MKHGLDKNGVSRLQWLSKSGLMSSNVSMTKAISSTMIGSRLITSTAPQNQTTITMSPLLKGTVKRNLHLRTLSASRVAAIFDLSRVM